jgi:RNA processing factor Prp31
LIFIQNIKRNKSTAEIQRSVEHDPEYLLILDVNNLLLKSDIIRNFIRRIYHRSFAELEKLVQQPMDYF